MPATLAQRQQASIRRDADRDLRRKARKRLRELRDAVRAAKQQRREALRAVAASCRAAKRAVSARAKRARERLSASVKRTRKQAQNVCQVARGDANARALEQIDRHLSSLQGELAEQRRFRLWAKPARLGGRSAAAGGGRGRARERIEESDSEVSANLDDPGLRVVWEAVKHRIKPSTRRSRTEAFLEWAAEHQGDVYRIQEADAVRHLETLEREQFALQRALRRKGRLSAADLDPVPF